MTLQTTRRWLLGDGLCSSRPYGVCGGTADGREPIVSEKPRVVPETIGSSLSAVGSLRNSAPLHETTLHGNQHNPSKLFAALS